MPPPQSQPAFRPRLPPWDSGYRSRGNHATSGTAPCQHTSKQSSSDRSHNKPAICSQRNRRIEQDHQQQRRQQHTRQRYAIEHKWSARIAQGSRRSSRSSLKIALFQEEAQAHEADDARRDHQQRPRLHEQHPRRYPECRKACCAHDWSHQVADGRERLAHR